MEIIGQKVTHKTFGIGTIINYYGKPQNINKYITVVFDSKSVELPYPSSFNRFLQAVDTEFAKIVAEALEKMNQTEINEETTVSSSLVTRPQTQNHKPISYCSINTFVFKKETGYNKSKRKFGFLVFDKSGRNIGVTFMNDDKRRTSFGQAEICFFDEYIGEFGEWRLISIDKERLSFEKLSKKLEEQGFYEVTIDPRKGS